MFWDRKRSWAKAHEPRAARMPAAAMRKARASIQGKKLVEMVRRPEQPRMGYNLMWQCAMAISDDARGRARCRGAAFGTGERRKRDARSGLFQQGVEPGLLEMVIAGQGVGDSFPLHDDELFRSNTCLRRRWSFLGGTVEVVINVLRGVVREAFGLSGKLQEIIPNLWAG